MNLARKIILGLMTLAVVLFTSAIMYLFLFGGIEREVNAYIGDLVGEHMPLDISVGKIEGSLISEIVLEDIKVVFQSESGPFEIINIPLMKATYSLSSLLRGQYQFSELEIERPQLVITRDADGTWIIPGLQLPQRDNPAPTVIPPIDVGTFMLTEGNLKLCDGSDTTIVEELAIFARFEAHDKVQSLDLEQISFQSDNSLLSMQSGGCKITIQGSQLILQDGFFYRGTTKGRVSGSVDLESTEGWVDINIDNLSLEEVSQVTGVKLFGELDINGRIELGRGVSADQQLVQGQLNLGGTFMGVDFDNLTLGVEFADNLLSLDTLYGSIMGGCAIDGKGAIDFSSMLEQYWLEASIRNFSLNKIVHTDFESDLNGEIYIDGESFSNATLELALSVDLDESVFHEYHFHRGRGDLLITSDSLVFADSFLISYYDNDFLVSGKIEYSDQCDLTIEAALNDLARYEGKLFLDQPAGRAMMQATLTGATISPDLTGQFQSDSLWLYGFYADSAFGSFEIDRMFSSQRGEVSAQFFAGSAWEMAYDSVSLRARPDSNLLFIDSVGLSNSVASLWAAGRLDHGAYPQQVAFDTLGVIFFDLAFANQGEVLIEVDSNGFNFQELTIGRTGSRLSAKGEVNYDETMALVMQADRIRLSPWLSLFDETPPMDGRLSATIDLEGDFESPRFSFSGSIDSLLYYDTTNRKGGDLLLGDLALESSYDQGLLKIDTLHIDSKPGQYSASGFIHADLAFSSEVEERFPNEPFDIFFTANDNRFDLVTFMMPSVEQLDGQLTADVHFAGRPDDPHLEGSVTMREVRLKYFDLAQPILADSASVSMNDNRIIIDQLPTYVIVNDLRIGAVADGSISVTSMDNLNYDLTVRLLDDFAFSYELEDIDGIVSGTLAIKGDTPPTVTGNLTLTGLNYKVPFAEEDEGSPIMLGLAGENTWDLNLDLDIISNFWIKNPDIDAEFGGQMTLLREAGVSRFQGELEILRGKAYLYDKVFNIEQESRVFFQGDKNINPRLDIRATTRVLGIVQADEVDAPREQVELCVLISGTLDVPEINPCEGSAFTREDMLPLLIANYYEGDTLQISSALGERLTSLVSNQVSQLAAKHTSVGTIEIDPAYYGKLDWSRTSVKLGFYTTSDLYVYGRSVPGQGQFGQSYGFELRFSRALSMAGNRSDEDEYILNLKLHLEF